MKPDHTAELSSTRRLAFKACWMRTLTPAPIVSTLAGPSALLLISKFWLTCVNGLRLPRFPLWPSSCGQSTLASQRDASVTSSRANDQALLPAVLTRMNSDCCCNYSN